ncbi:ABC transporter ATP-binding protein [Enterococcus florum]|uniref:ABC transporter ATP-binding protein n=1 Tax=Enterococcus florum TaxID=2480627 RepID=A0A4P5P5U7_9ENTE|nr:ABC transporter ATP-binding protein [Enterococcus florum]GCF93235.1 ABC transporter ATP-binding protein [Enterococcus florum]
MSMITVKQLNKRFGDQQVLQNVSLEVKKGTVFGLLGPNGAGKTTLIECILGLQQADSGEALLFGESVRKNRQRLFERIGVQLQASHYQPNINVYEICQEMTALYQAPLDYNELLDRFNLSAIKKQRVNSLSGGQKQRLSLILALLPNPEIVFLDELTTGLDTEARREVWAILRELKKSGLTIFLTSHYMEEAEQLCDELLFLRKGKVLEQRPLKIIQQEKNFVTLEEYYLEKMEETA